MRGTLSSTEHDSSGITGFANSAMNALRRPSLASSWLAAEPTDTSCLPRSHSPKQGGTMKTRVLRVGLTGVAVIGLALACEKGGPTSAPAASRVGGISASEDAPQAAGASSASGTYQVTALVRFDVAPGTGASPTVRAGLAVLRIAYSDGSRGILVVSCHLTGTPSVVFEGITASRGFTDFWNRLPPVPGVDGNRTVFHVINEEED